MSRALCVLFAFLSYASTASAYCFICGTGMGPLKARQGTYLKRNSDLTCSKLDLDIINLSANHPTCTESISLYRPACCDADFVPEDFSSGNTESDSDGPPPQPAVTGPHPYCPVCFMGVQRDANGKVLEEDGKAIFERGGWPARGNDITFAVLGLEQCDNGNGCTCKMLFHLGEQGYISEALCRNVMMEIDTECMCPDPNDTNNAPVQEATQPTTTTVATTSTKPAPTTTQKPQVLTAPADYQSPVAHWKRDDAYATSKNALMTVNSILGDMMSSIFSSEGGNARKLRTRGA